MTRRSPRPAVAAPPAPPRREATPAKISDVVLAFAKPVIALGPTPPSLDQVRTAMALATVAWNLPVYVRERRPEAAAFRARLDAALASAGPKAREVVSDLMIARLTKHAADPRTIVVEVRAGTEGEAPVVVTIGTEG